jgi:predicted SAM-dependent methyltransferase
MNSDNKIPLLSKYNLYKVINPLFETVFKLIKPNPLIKNKLQQLGIEHLNLGGYRPTEGYLNVQLSPVELYGIPTIKHTTIVLSETNTGEIKQEERILSTPALSIHYNILNGLPLDSASFSGINMSHLFEHFTREDGLKVLEECHRILEPGGILRISCPDLLMYAKAYVNRDASFFESRPIKRSCCYEGLKTYGDRFISKAYDNQNGHKWFYDAESMIQLLHDAGFQIVEEKRVHESKLPNIEAIEPGFRFTESFYVESIK